MKFFTIPHDRLREFAGEAKSRGLLYVVIRDKKNPQFSEIMVYADDAAKVNRVLDKMNLDFVKSEAGEAVVEQAPVREGERVIDAEFTEKTEATEELPVKTEKVVLPEGTIEFELDEEEHLFEVGEVQDEPGLCEIRSRGSGCGTSASPGNRACDRCRVYRENRSKRRTSGKDRKGGAAGRDH